jgi:hypothetical protein
MSQHFPIYVESYTYSLSSLKLSILQLTIIALAPRVCSDNPELFVIFRNEGRWKVKCSIVLVNGMCNYFSASFAY